MTLHIARKAYFNYTESVLSIATGADEIIGSPSTSLTILTSSVSPTVLE